MNGGYRGQRDYKRAWKKVSDSQIQVLILLRTDVLCARGGRVFPVSRTDRMNPGSPTCRTASGTQEPTDRVHRGCTSQPPRQLQNYSVPGTYPLPISSIRIWVSGTQVDVFLKHFR